MAYYGHSLCGTKEPPNLTEYKLFYYNTVGETQAKLTIYEQPLLGVLSDRKYYVILEDGSDRSTYFVKIRVEDKRCKFEPFDPKAMVEQVVRIVEVLLSKKRFEERMAQDKSHASNGKFIFE